MNELQKRAIQSKIEEIKANGSTQADIARSLGVSDATISDIAKGHFHKVKKPMWLRLGAKLLTGQALPLKMHEVMMRYLKTAKVGHIPLLLDGMAGLGKTTAAREFARLYPSETYLVRCSGDFSAKEFMRECARRIGVSDQGSRTDIRRAITQKLSGEQHPILMIDEAENLTEGAYSAIKSMYDDNEGKASLVLIGANSYSERLKKLAARKKGCFPQLWSRYRQVSVVLDNRVLPEDIDILKEQCGINDPRVLNQMLTASDYRDVFYLLKQWQAQQAAS